MVLLYFDAGALAGGPAGLGAKDITKLKPKFKDGTGTGIRRVELANGEPEELLVEEPLILRVAGEDLVTMRTPGHDEELALGFLITERILPSPASILATRSFVSEGIAGLEITLAEGLKGRGGRLTRVHEIRASCGLCGAPSIDAIASDLPTLVPARPRFSLGEVEAWLAEMGDAQALFQRTGAAHAAGLMLGGELRLVREDVGRHNAVDKLIGAAIREGIDLTESIMLLSGRGGFELVMKALRVGIPAILSISAATSFAVALAEEAGATLVGFTRGGGGVIYCDDGRLR